MTTTDDRYNGLSSEDSTDDGPRNSRPDEFQGWTNRETWALNLWLSNDEGLYNMTRERVAAAIEVDENLNDYNNDFTPAEALMYRRDAAGQAVKELWDEITDPAGDFAPLSAEIAGMIADVGSLWRVNWDEIGAAWLEDLDES